MLVRHKLRLLDAALDAWFSNTGGWRVAGLGFLAGVVLLIAIKVTF